MNDIRGMGVNLAIFLVYLLVGLSLVLSIKMQIKVKHCLFIKNLFWYCLAAFLLINLMTFGEFLGLSVRSVVILNVLSSIFNFCFFGIFILKHLRSTINLNCARLTFFLFYLLTLYATVYELTYFNVSGFFFIHFGLLILSAIYFFDLFHNIPSKPFWICPEFWIISGVFTSNTIFVPLYGFENFYPNVKQIISGYTSIISGIGLGVLYIFICKGIICSLRTQK